MSKLTILLAEDCRPDVFLIRTALREARLECELLAVEDGASAIALLQRLGTELPPLDLALIDLNLPKADGTELIALLRNHPGCGSTPVIVMTSSDSPADRARTAKLRVDAYFRKPSSLDEFMRLGEVVRNVLERRSSRAGGAS